MPRHRAPSKHSAPSKNRAPALHRGPARHRAPSSQSHTLRGVAATVTVTGAALGASALAATPAYAATAHGSHLSSGHDGSHHRHYRPMTSGEEQYRNGCHQGYISDDCEQFSVTNLLHHGIDPYL
jgi:hypothetical protein